MNRARAHPRTLTAWLVALGMLCAALVACVHNLPAPTGWSVSDLATWYERQSISATFRLMSLGALTIVLYLMLSTVAVTLAAWARASRLPRLERLPELIAIPAVKRALSALLGLGITLSAGAQPAYGGDAGQPTPITLDRPPTEGATMRSLGPEPDQAGPAVAPATAHQWRIEPGDHLWGLSETTLATAWGRPPTDHETATFVREVVTLNRDVLVVPDDPDLVFPGQVFVLPSIP